MLPQRFSHLGKEETRRSDNDAFDQGELQASLGNTQGPIKSSEMDYFSKTMSDTLNKKFDLLGRGEEVDLSIQEKKYLVYQLKVREVDQIPVSTASEDRLRNLVQDLDSHLKTFLNTVKL